MTTKYNKTQLSPDVTMERHVYHRDQFAHYLRWTHVLKRLKINQNVLDWGCANGNLLEVMYRNRYKGECYLGLDIRNRTIEKAQDKYRNVEWANFLSRDLCCPNNVVLPDKFVHIIWDMICCFEVIEHIGKQNTEQFLSNLNAHATAKTVILLSTPNYDEKVGAAANHIIDGEICEFGYRELESILENQFEILHRYGTFASVRDYKPLMTDAQREFYEQAHEYFDLNILSNLMAPLFPEHSRNCLWVLKKKNPYVHTSMHVRIND